MVTVHCLHASKASLWYMVISHLKEYLTQQHIVDESNPSGLAEFEQVMGLKVVVTNTSDDKDSAGMFVRNRLAI